MKKYFNNKKVLNCFEYSFYIYENLKIINYQTQHNMNNFYVQSYKDTKHEIYKSTNDTLRNYLYDIFRYYEN